MSKAPDSQTKEDRPHSGQLSTIFQGGLLFLGIMACMYAAREVVLPIVLPFFLKLLVQPGMKLMKHLRIPRLFAALLAMALLLGCVVGLVFPAPFWRSLYGRSPRSSATA